MSHLIVPICLIVTQMVVKEENLEGLKNLKNLENLENKIEIYRRYKWKLNLII
jgi:hypothetical protein